MLGKLIRYEWKASWKLIAAMNLFTILITLIGSVSFFARLWYGESRVTLAVVCLIFYYLSIFVVSIASSIYIAYRFYKNYYTDEGYLMHTLPVTTHQLILSKLIISTVYRVITTFIIITSILAISYCAYHSLDAVTAAKISSEFVNEVLPEFTSILSISLPDFCLLMIFFCFLGNVYNVLSLYSAISLGQLFTKHKLMASILCYIGIYMLVQTVMAFASAPFLVVNVVSEGAYPSMFMTLMILSFVLTVVLSIVSYFLANYVMKKKLNLD